MARGRKPKLFSNPSGTLKSAKKTFESSMTSNLANAISKSPDVKVEVVKPNYLKVTEKRMIKAGVVDLKPYFARSPKRKITKSGKNKGGWYINVPIQLKARKVKRKTYDELNSTFKDLGPSSTATRTIQSLNTGRNVGTLSSLNHKHVANNVTATKSATGRRTSYVAFRRVSNKSPKGSWIVGRKNLSSANTSKTMQRNIDNLLKHNMKNL